MLNRLEINTPISVDVVDRIASQAGYRTEKGDKWVRLEKDGINWFVELDELPKVFILCNFRVDTATWDVELLREAANLMMQDIIMVKARIIERSDDVLTLRFYIYSMDRNATAFRQNLPEYMGMFWAADRRLRQIYDGLVQHKAEMAVADNLINKASRSGNRVTS